MEEQQRRNYGGGGIVQVQEIITPIMEQCVIVPPLPGPPPPPTFLPPLPSGPPPLDALLFTKECNSNNNNNVRPALASISDSSSSGDDYRKFRRRPRGVSFASPSDDAAMYYFDSYEELMKIGQGTFGTVTKARDRKTLQVVAMKKIKLENETEGFPVTALREIKILSKLKHENIVKLIRVVSSKPTDSNRNKGNVYMVFEYAACDLTGLMEDDNVKLSELHCKCLFKQILEGLHFAHANKVLHRDLKAANVLVTSEGVVKIADWGLSRVAAEPNGRFTNRVVTLWYRAPELLLGETQYTSAVDMWAAGCLFAELLGKRSILPGKDELGQLKLIFDLCGHPTEETWPGWNKLPLASGLIPPTPPPQPVGSRQPPSEFNLRFAWMSPHAKDLLSRMLTVNPSKRISASDALYHEYFWSTPMCQPKDIPVPVGDGMHEFQVRERKSAKTSVGPHAGYAGGGR